ncbi:MAG: non-canonical purine NTP pyrophosphatase [Candidatus Dormibacteria bacterium]
MSVAPPALVIASSNPGKVREFRRLLAPWPGRLLSLAEAGFGGELEEPGETYAENAAAKALAVAEALGVTALADDSGIEVDALGGWPGPRSARWLGDGASDLDRLLALLEEVDRRCPDRREVRYVCAVVLARPAAEPIVAHGDCRGLLVAPRGRRGFGYDAGFLSGDLGVTFGEASDGAKDGVSHRARALRGLAGTAVLDPPLSVL